MKTVFTTLVFLGVLLVLPGTMHAQKKVTEIKITGIQGTALGSDNETPAQVTQRAINEAKVEALKQAGVEESIASFTDYFQAEDNERYEELFTSDILSDIRGAVKEVEILEENRSFDESGRIQVDVLINCTVVKYISEKDVAFDAWIDGVGMFYANGTNLKFKVKPSKDGYVIIFIFSESDAFQLFPNEYEPSYLLQANQSYFFPSELMDYTLYTDKKSEIHRMVMVFMKENIPYTREVKYKNIVDWIFSIPPDMRVIKSFGFSVVNEDKMKD
ncbi:MAG: DUF4384 domain-containing protein [Bacteroidales bacterium]|jgi:hypothetical protein|nr:DUF4384 domain-containing protein [Bacteroidales bacterium]